MAGLSAVCPGCRHEIQIPSAAACRRAIAEQANITDRCLLSEAQIGSSSTQSTEMGRPRPPRPGLVAKSPTPAAEELAKPAIRPASGSTRVTSLQKAGQRPQPGARWSHRLGIGALFLCVAALFCAWVPRLSILVIPLSVAGVLVGLSGLLLVLYAAEKRLFPVLAGAAGSSAILLTALYFPEHLGSVYMASRAKRGVDPAVIRAVPIEGSFHSSAPLDADWVDAAKASLQFGQVNVQVLGVTIRRAEGVKSSAGKRLPAGNYCFVRIRTQEQVAAIQFAANRSQAHGSPIEGALLKLTGSENKSYELHGVVKVEAVDKQRRGPAFPMSFQDHVFIFEAPAARPDHLRLEIAAEAWGGEGAFRFSIPGRMIRDERGKPGRS